MGDLSQRWSDARPSTPSGDGSDSGRLTRWSAALLSRFSVIWPKAWADVTALTPHELLVAEWAKGLDGLTAEEIRQGLDHCRSNLTWPPAIAEFRAACHGGANAEQRAFAARAQREAEERRPALTKGTWGDAAANVREHVQRAQRQINERPERSLVNIANGTWTREMEAKFRHHANLLASVNTGLSRLLRPTEWPDGEVA